MGNFFDKLIMYAYGDTLAKSDRRPTKDINEASWIYIPDEETAEQLSEWSKANYYPALIDCEPGWYYWHYDDETFYKES